MVRRNLTTKLELFRLASFCTIGGRGSATPATKLCLRKEIQQSASENITPTVSPALLFETVEERRIIYLPRPSGFFLGRPPLLFVR